MSDNDPSLPLTLTVPVFGKLAYGLSENAAYEAASRGDIPTVDMSGRLKRVPVRVALLKIAGGDREVLKAVTKDLATKLIELQERAA
jgi:hypothetical protein